MRAVFYNLAIFYQVSAEKVGILGMDGTLYPVDETVLVDDGFPEKKTILINFLEMSIKIQLVTFNVIQWHSQKSGLVEQFCTYFCQKSSLKIRFL